MTPPILHEETLQDVFMGARGRLVKVADDERMMRFWEAFWRLPAPQQPAAKADRRRARLEPGIDTFDRPVQPGFEGHRSQRVLAGRP